MTHSEVRWRNEAIREAVAAGMSRMHAAIVFGCGYATVAQASRGIKQPRKPKAPDARVRRMAEMYRAGLTLQQVGDRYKITRERVRQLLRLHGVGAEEGGQRLRGAATRARKAAARDALYMQRYGCSVAEYRAIGYRARRAFAEQKRNADSRAIEWALTLKQWWDLWQQSGHWHERGRGAEKYCMARLSDRGGYTFGNVYITTIRENGREYQLTRDRTKKAPARGVYLLYPGRKKPYVAKVNRKSLGLFATVEDAVAARAAALAA